MFRLTGMSWLLILKCDIIYKVHGQELCLMEQGPQFPSTLRPVPRLSVLSLSTSMHRTCLVMHGCGQLPSAWECHILRSLSHDYTMWRRVWMKMFLFPQWDWQEHTKPGVIMMDHGSWTSNPSTDLWASEWSESPPTTQRTSSCHSFVTSTLLCPHPKPRLLYHGSILPSLLCTSNTSFRTGFSHSS